MSDDITEKEYRADVLSIAQEALTASDPQEFITESVEGSQWVIYTYRARHVLMFSRNEESIVEDLGRDAFSGISSLAELYTVAAAFAMRADVLEAFEEARAEAEETEEAL
jgi:hypothetical protein